MERSLKAVLRCTEVSTLRHRPSVALAEEVQQAVSPTHRLYSYSRLALDSHQVHSAISILEVWRQMLHLLVLSPLRLHLARQTALEAHLLPPPRHSQDLAITALRAFQHFLA